MKKLVLLLAAGIGALHVFSQTTCATAIPIGFGSYSAPGIVASEVPDPICTDEGFNVVTGSLWYTFTLDVDTAVVLSSALSGVDTRVHVYTGACGALTCVSGDDDSGPGYTSIDTFNVLANVTYIIAFDDEWSNSPFTFTITGVAPVVPVEGTVQFQAQSIPGIAGTTYGVVDMNADGLDDIVSVDYNSGALNVMRQVPGNVFEAHNYPGDGVLFPATWSLSAGDLDGNGYNDVQYGDYGGVTYMMANDDGTAYTPVNFSQFVFSQRGNMVDINNDGHLDAFMCHDIDANVYYLNDGTGNLTFHQGGFGTTCGNYGSAWVDYDGDGDQDIFVAKCGCDPVDILERNNGDGTFTSVSAELGFADQHQSWSSAWGDFDNDGDMDVLIGSSSSNVHKLMRNNGDGTFTNVTAGSGFDTFGGQNIEWNTRDFNNDGFLDIIGASAIHYGRGDMTFLADMTGPNNGPIGDLNNDGFLDVMAGNTAYMNQGNDNNWVVINTVGTVSNNNGIGARVTISSALGDQIREVRSGDGFAYMSSLKTYFGLGQDTEIDHITIHWPSGVVNVVEHPEINTTVTVVEDVNTSVTNVAATDRFSVYPNPAMDMLTLTGTAQAGNVAVRVFNVSGQQVLSTSARGGRVNVSSLSAGVYVLETLVNDKPQQATFVKQ